MYGVYGLSREKPSNFNAAMLVGPWAQTTALTFNPVDLIFVKASRITEATSVDGTQELAKK